MAPFKNPYWTISLWLIFKLFPIFFYFLPWTISLADFRFPPIAPSKKKKTFPNFPFFPVIISSELFQKKVVFETFPIFFIGLGFSPSSQFPIQWPTDDNNLPQCSSYLVARAQYPTCTIISFLHFLCSLLWSLSFFLATTLQPLLLKDMTDVSCHSFSPCF